MKPFCLWMLITLLTGSLHAEIVTLTAKAPPGTSNSTQIVIETNTVLQILHINDSQPFTGTVTVQKNDLTFNYYKNSLESTVNNMPVLSGPATVIVSTSATIASGTTNYIMCTLAVTTQNQSTTNQFTPNTGVVIPADSGGPVNIILESSVDLINWIPANPGTYGTTTTNRFFRVRATR